MVRLQSHSFYSCWAIIYPGGWGTPELGHPELLSIAMCMKKHVQYVKYQQRKRSTS